MRKSKIIDLMEDLYEEFENNGGDSYFEIDGEKYYTDAGYALDGIRIFIKVMRKRLKTGFTRKDLIRLERKWKESLIPSNSEMDWYRENCHRIELPETEIRVGDEVINNDFRGMVTRIHESENLINILWEDGNVGVYGKDVFRLSGRHHVDVMKFLHGKQEEPYE